MHFQQGVLAPSLRPLAENLTENCVVSLKKYFHDDGSAFRPMHLTILDLEIMASAQAERVGNPVSIETAPCGLNAQLAHKIMKDTLSGEDLASLIVAGAQIDAPARWGSHSTSQIPLVRAVNTGSAAIVQWLIDAGACVYSHINPQHREDESGVDVLLFAASVGQLECLKVLLDTGMESRLHDKAMLLSCAGQLLNGPRNREVVETEILREIFESDPDFDPDEHAGDFGMDLQDMVHEKIYTKTEEIYQTISEVLEQRALVQAYRRLALCAGACGSRLGVESPIGQTNPDVIDYLLNEHLMIAKPRMPGAPVSGAVLRRFAHH